jgi:hypothetical protein
MFFSHCESLFKQSAFMWFWRVRWMGISANKMLLLGISGISGISGICATSLAALGILVGWGGVG